MFLLFFTLQFRKLLIELKIIILFALSLFMFIILTYIVGGLKIAKNPICFYELLILLILFILYMSILKNQNLKPAKTILFWFMPSYMVSISITYPLQYLSRKYSFDIAAVLGNLTAGLMVICTTISILLAEKEDSNYSSIKT